MQSSPADLADAWAQFGGLRAHLDSRPGQTRPFLASKTLDLLRDARMGLQNRCFRK
jgi:hypothetical protein